MGGGEGATYAYNPNIQEVDTRRSEIPCLHVSKQNKCASCLDLFGLLQQNKSRVAYEQQEMISPGSGCWEV